ncbi:ribonuclease domain-containing protein [Streptomyces specialis]|uniref:ribonuclease domain-containing protein n=1 Tax=Streptomyces specialis TaxID=498367 RepID=UPI00073F141F|nr:ribonuclease [Streptomyces specialis]
MGMNPRTVAARTGAIGALLSTLLVGGWLTPATAATAPHSTTAVATEVTPLAFGDICYSDLPAEAHDTLDLIEAGGPFPYPQDGGTFYNREGLLPSHPTGYYHEYTVETPGSDTRGARRIVTGDSYQEDYYTADHYESFDLIDYTC